VVLLLSGGWMAGKKSVTLVEEFVEKIKVCQETEPS